MKCRILPILIALAVSACTPSQRILVGTYTENTSAEGVYLYQFSPKGAVLKSCAPAGNPSFVIASGNRAYSVNEFNDGRQGLSAYVIDGDNISLIESKVMPDSLVDGRDPCNILLVDGRLITSNYTGGSASAYSVAEDGSIGEPLQFFSGGEGSHIHCAVLSPDGKYLFLTDLGRDCVFRFDLGPNGQPFGESVIAWQNVDSFPYGPRHMVISADGKYAYLLCELGDMLVVFSYVDGALTPVQTLKAYDGDGHGSADIHLSPDGKFLYTSHRLKEDGISIYKVDSGLVERVGFCPTGKHPRNFAISPDGKYLLCACRDDNRIEVYRRDAHTGMLEATGQDIPVGAPVCVQFIP